MMIMQKDFESIERDYLELKWLKDEVCRRGLFKDTEVCYQIYTIASDYQTEKGPAMIAFAGTSDTTIIHLPEYLDEEQVEVVLEIFSRELKNKNEQIKTFTKREFDLVKSSPYYNEFSVELVE